MPLPTVTLNETTPAGGAYVRDGDDRIREYKIQNREILEIDHYYPSSGQNAACGRHKQMTLIEAADIGTGATGVPVLGAQTASGKPELVFTDEDDTDVQLTSGGLVNDSVQAKTGDWMLSSVTTARVGWTNVSATYSNKFIRINATPLTTGGADTHTHTGPSHTHSVPRDWTSNGTGSAGRLVVYGGYSDNYPSVDNTSGAGGTGNTSSGDNVPAYVQVVIFQKD